MRTQPRLGVDQECTHGSHFLARFEPSQDREIISTARTERHFDTVEHARHRFDEDDPVGARIDDGCFGNSDNALRQRLARCCEGTCQRLKLYFWMCGSAAGSSL